MSTRKSKQRLSQEMRNTRSNSSENMLHQNITNSQRKKSIPIGNKKPNCIINISSSKRNPNVEQTNNKQKMKKEPNKSQGRKIMIGEDVLKENEKNLLEEKHKLIQNLKKDREDEKNKQKKGKVKKQSKYSFEEEQSGNHNKNSNEDKDRSISLSKSLNDNQEIVNKTKKRSQILSVNKTVDKDDKVIKKKRGKVQEDENKSTIKLKETKSKINDILSETKLKTNHKEQLSPSPVQKSTRSKTRLNNQSSDNLRGKQSIQNSQNESIKKNKNNSNLTSNKKKNDEQKEKQKKQNQNERSQSNEARTKMSQPKFEEQKEDKNIIDVENKYQEKRGRKAQNSNRSEQKEKILLSQDEKTSERNQKKSDMSQEKTKQSSKSNQENRSAGIFSKNPAQNQLTEIKQKPITKTIRDKYSQAIEMLQEYSLPEEIPCRENEKKEILEFINEGLNNNGCSSCLYISGVPGIGKTASFLEVIKKLQKEKEDDFKFIHINAMNLSNPENLYFILVKEITGISCNSKHKACQILNELFTRGKVSKQYEQYNESIDKRNKVILLDELDFLVTKDQELLYNLMEWPHHKHAKLTIVGIANTMNLPENLMNKIKSRMGSRRLVFNQYNHKQIHQIIKTRLEKVQEVFEPSAIDFACRKIAISSSDIRKTLKVLRKAVEMCSKLQPTPQQEQPEKKQTKKDKQAKEPQQEEKLVNIPLIQQAYSSLYSSPILQAIQKLSFHHKVIILSIALENKHRGIPISYLSESYGRYRIMLSNLGHAQTLNHGQIKQVLNQLSSLNLLSQKEKSVTKESQFIGLDPNKKHFSNVIDIQITSNFSVDDITNSLCNDEVYLKFQFQF